MDLERLKRIIQYHFDLELLLKYRELKLIELELERGREIRACLEKLLINEAVYPDRFNRQDYSMFTNTLSLKRSSSMPGLNNPNIASSSSNTNSDTKYQYELRADGSVVKLRCPACNADKFKSMLGFLNHCRIHCHVLFTSPEDRQQRAGVPVDPATVPLEFFARHPTVLKQEQDLAIIRADLQPVFPEPMTAIDGHSASELEDKLLNGSEPLLGEVTRFCVHKRLIIGNNARCLRAGDSKNPQCTHSWRIYLRPPPPNIAGQRDSLSRWIRFVRFHLHPSYSESVVDVHEEPFELSRDTFGEFPVRVQLHFWDSKRNPPFDIIHHIKVFQAVNPGKLINGPERMYEVELDRNTDFSLSLVGTVTSAVANVQPTMPRSDYDILRGVLLQKTKFDEIPIDSNNTISGMEIAKLAYCEGIREQIRQRNASFCLTSHEILSWISVNRPDFFKAEIDIAVSEISVQPPKRYCCYCGQPHEPVHRFEILQKNCSFKPRKVRLCSRTDLTSFVAGKYALSDTALSDDSRYLGYKLNTSHNYIPSVKLKSIIPSDRSLIPTVHEDRMSGEAKAVSNALVKIFAKRLIARAISVASDTKPSLQSTHTSSTSQMLTPLHLYTALTSSQGLSDNPMDFITLENMQA